MAEGRLKGDAGLQVHFVTASYAGEGTIDTM